MEALADPLVAQLLQRCPQLVPSRRAVSAVSGGADSMALLILAVAAGCEVSVIHVDHGLRADSADDVGIVAAAAARFAVPFESRRVIVDPTGNVEANARAARHQVIGPDALTGHTADDQAETVLLNLMRGAGSDGLAAMSADRHPLLGLRRAETVALCRAIGMATIDDPTNRLPIFQRNRVRHELLPLLADISRRDPVPILVRQAELLAADADLLNELAATLDATDAKALAAAPVALARRALRAWLSNPYPPDAASIERVLAVARGEVKACELNDGRRIFRRSQHLWLEAQPAR